MLFSARRQTVAFVDKSSATLRATSAIPLDGLEAGLLALQPFRFGDCVDDSDHLSFFSSSSSPALPSSASSAASTSSLPDSEESEGGGRHGDDEAGADDGDDNVEDAGRRGSSHEAGQSSDGAREGRAEKTARRNDGGNKEDAPFSPPASLPEAPQKAVAAAARPGTSGGSPALPSPGRRRRDEPRMGSPAARRHGWVRGRSGISSSRRARNCRSGSGGGGRSPTSSASGCWVPPPTRWGGTPIKSGAFWGSWGEGSAAVAHAKQEGANARDDGDPRSGSSMQSPFGDDDDDGRGGTGGDQESQWDEQEEPREEEEDSSRGGVEFFRTADGRSLFAESLGNLSSDDSIQHGARREVQWGEVFGSGRRRPGKHRGFLCLLGEEGCRPSERGAAEAKRLGVAARHRRARIDARSRDGKRMAETLVARKTIKRLEEEVGTSNPSAGTARIREK